MPDPKATPLLILGDLKAALGLLTRLPMPLTASEAERGAKAAWAWPLAGAVVGALAGIVAWAALWLGLPAGAAAVLAMMAQTLVTGGLHEDGLSDTADGLWGGWTPERRLEIMKDSRVGSYGVLALILTCLGQWVALSEILTPTTALPLMVAVGALSRLPMVILMAALPQARADGLSTRTGRPDVRTSFGAAVLSILIWILAGWPVVAPILVLAGTALWLGWTARNRIGGQTGDILGASQQIGAVALLFAVMGASQ